MESEAKRTAAQRSGGSKGGEAPLVSQSQTQTQKEDEIARRLMGEAGGSYVRALKKVHGEWSVRENEYHLARQALERAELENYSSTSKSKARAKKNAMAVQRVAARKTLDALMNWWDREGREAEEEYQQQVKEAEEENERKRKEKEKEKEKSPRQGSGGSKGDEVPLGSMIVEKKKVSGLADDLELLADELEEATNTLAEDLGDEGEDPNVEDLARLTVTAREIASAVRALLPPSSSSGQKRKRSRGEDEEEDEKTTSGHKKKCLRL